MFNLWKQFGRDSLVARLVALVIGVSVLSLVLHLVVTLNFVRVLATDFTSVLTAMVRSERALLALTAPAERDSLAGSLTRAQHRVSRLKTNESTETIAPSRVVSAQLLEDMRQRVDPDVDVSIRIIAGAPMGEGIFYVFNVGSERWQIVHEPSSPTWIAITGIIGWLVMVALAVIIAASVGLALVNRPIRKLSAQLSGRNGALDPLEVPDRADREIRNFVESFNRVVDSNAQAARTKQQMLVGISHDLRTPLTRLRFRVEMACDEKSLREIDRDLTALERIVTQFVGYAQSESHVGYGEPWPLNEVVDRIVSTYVTQGAPVVFKSSAVATPIPDLAIQRALTNLIDNALEYGGVPVEVELSLRQSILGEETTLTVWDEGEGMSDAEFERAVQPFSRLTDDRGSQGHCGLGLAIVAQIASQTQGTLHIVRGARNRFGISLFWRTSNRITA